MLALYVAVFQKVTDRPFLVADKESLVFERVDANVWVNDPKEGARGSPRGSMFFRTAGPTSGYLKCQEEGSEEASYERCPLTAEIRAAGRQGPTRADLEIAKIDYRWLSWMMGGDHYVLRSHRTRKD